MANVLIIGRRRKCYQAAIELGHQTFLWSDGELHESRKKHLKGWIESPFEENLTDLSDHVKEKIHSFGLQYVVAATESSVDLAAMVREELKLPGTSIEVSNLLHNKHKMKVKARKFDIPITDFKLITESDTATDIIKLLGLPLILKPTSESGARGVVLLKDLASVEKHLKPGLLAETYVEGSEVSVETFVYKGEPIFHNITDYLHQWKKSILPAEIPEELKQSILKVNDQVIKSFGVENGMTHSEFYLTNKGPIFGEMAVRPPGGYYMELIEEAYGFNPWKAYVQIECEGQKPELNLKPQKLACVYIIHPEQGTATKISGVDRVRQIPEIFEFKFRLHVGDVVEEREATSNECGHVLMSGVDQNVLLNQLQFIEKSIQIDLSN